MTCPNAPHPCPSPHHFAGSMDTTVTVWSSNRSVPLLHLKQCFHSSVVDLSWSADGRTLLAASHDGTVLVIRWVIVLFGVVLQVMLRTKRFIVPASISICGSQLFQTPHRDTRILQPFMTWFPDPCHSGFVSGLLRIPSALVGSALMALMTHCTLTTRTLCLLFA